VRAALVVAGGTGERFGRAGGKQLAGAAGAPVILVCPPDRVDEFRSVAEAAARPGRDVSVVAGGSTRLDSVAAGLAALPPDCTIVAVHDGARPLADPDTVDRAVAELESRPALDGVVVGHPVPRPDDLDGVERRVSDDHAVERDGGVVGMLEGPRWNIKVTVPEDLIVVEALLRARGESSPDE
jgi:2-C-methyl-D-erythritol 4-phosphate cytidylyltransferase